MGKQKRTPDPTWRTAISRKTRIALAAVAALFVAGLIARANDGESTEPPPEKSLMSVWYEVEGDSSRARVTIETGTVTRQSTVAVPMKDEANATGVRVTAEPETLVYLSAQNDDQMNSGEITCRITVDGKVISENTAVGAYAIATCKGKA
jgi:hypothetical protein